MSASVHTYIAFGLGYCFGLTMACFFLACRRLSRLQASGGATSLLDYDKFSCEVVRRIFKGRVAVGGIVDQDSSEIAVQEFLWNVPAIWMAGADFASWHIYG